MAARKLRAVSTDPSADEPVAPTRIMSLSEAIESGIYLEILKAQRRDIVLSLPDERGPAKAALHGQLSKLSKEIEQLEAREEPDEGAGRGEVLEDGKFDASAI
jgi:hypothetical protein